MRQPFHKQDLNSQFIAVFWNLLLFWNRAFKIDLGILFYFCKIILVFIAYHEGAKIQKSIKIKS